VVDTAQTVFTVFKLLAFNLGVSFFSGGLLWFCRSANKINVAIQPALNALLELPLADVLLLRHAL